MTNLNSEALLDPAKTVISKFADSERAGTAIVSEITGAHVTRVYRWMREKAVGGTGGLIPGRHHQQILAAARERGIDLSAEELIGVAPIASHLPAD